MIAFVIALKSRAKSKNWTVDSLLLRRTLGSLLNQLDPRLRVYVAYTDLPENPVQDPRVAWLPFPYPFVEAEGIEDQKRYLEHFRLGAQLPGLFDQGRKSLFAAAAAKKDGCSYIMSVDYDDLLSNQIAGFVNRANPKVDPGWYLSQGYTHNEGSSYLIRVPSGINGRCGSTHIVRNDLVPDPDFASMRYADFQFFSSHAYLVENLRVTRGIELPPLPLCGLVYLHHHHNFANPIHQMRTSWLKRTLRWLFRGKPVSAAVRQEFGLLPIVLGQSQVLRSAAR